MTSGDNSAQEEIRKMIDTMLDKFLTDLNTEEKKEMLMAMMEKMNKGTDIGEMMHNSATGCCCR